VKLSQLKVGGHVKHFKAEVVQVRQLESQGSQTRLVVLPKDPGWQVITHVSYPNVELN